MNKIFISFFIIINFLISANAQDIILKNDGLEISVKVLEITEEYVKFKDFDFQDGPTRNIRISEIIMITYANGKKEIFNKQDAKPDNQENSNETISSDLKGEFFRIGTNDEAMSTFFKMNNFDNYHNDFKSACNMRNKGKGLLGAGLGLMFGGTGLLVVGLFTSDILIYVGSTLMSVGEVLTIVSIPVSAVAGSRKKVIKNNFSKEYFGIDGYTYQPTLNFGCTSNGFISLSLNF